MKIEDVATEGRRPAGTRARVLDFNERPDEVFRLRIAGTPTPWASPDAPPSTPSGRCYDGLIRARLGRRLVRLPRRHRSTHLTAPTPFSLRRPAP
jgi:hypothetical protein